MAPNSDSRELVTVLIAVLAALVLLPLLFMGFGMMGAGSMMGGAWGGHMWGDGAGWLSMVGLAVPLLFLVALVGGAILLHRAVGGAAGGGTDGGDPAIAELRSAYARGELSDEEYEQRRETLERDN